MVFIVVGRVWSRKTAQLNCWSSGTGHVLPL
nr:MAG TPA: hypothetical protein [Caudoviricetes sp.]